jgi:nucleotide-binding universal stress UspA family protein
VPDFLGTPFSERATAERITRAEAMARQLLREVGAIPGRVQTEVLAGTVDEVTRAVSQARGSDLIVVGSRENGPWRRLRAGGREPAGQALCPVMIVG